MYVSRILTIAANQPLRITFDEKKYMHREYLELDVYRILTIEELALTRHIQLKKLNG